MPDTWAARTGADYAAALRDLLPDGPAWPRQAGAYLQKWCSGIGRIWGDVDASAASLLVAESDPRAALVLLPDWERNFGLPDPCVTAPQTVAQRQINLVAKMTMLGGQSIAFFIAVAASLGYAVTITEYSPYTCGLSQCGDTRDDAGIPRWQLGAATIRFYWTVNVGLVSLSWLRCGTGRCGVDTSLTIGAAADLQCRLSQWAPAHTSVLFNFSGLATGGAFAGTP